MGKRFSFGDFPLMYFKGAFGPCDAGNIHYKQKCPCCNGEQVFRNVSTSTICPKCQGKGGFGESPMRFEPRLAHCLLQGAFGACEVYNVHYKSACALCNGKGHFPGVICLASFISQFFPPRLQSVAFTQCSVCQGKGGMGAFGPCEPGNVHFKSTCNVCQGRGYTFSMAEEHHHHHHHHHSEVVVVPTPAFQPSPQQQQGYPTSQYPPQPYGQYPTGGVSVSTGPAGFGFNVQAGPSGASVGFTGYPPAPNAAYPPSGAYPGYPPQTQGYPSQPQGYPSQPQGYAPQAQGYPPQQGYPGAYPPPAPGQQYPGYPPPGGY